LRASARAHGNQKLVQGVRRGIASDETGAPIIGGMPDRLLQFAPVTAGRDGRDCLYAYYGRYYVGCISASGDAWRAWLHDVRLGDFPSADAAKMAIVAEYYGPDARI